MTFAESYVKVLDEQELNHSDITQNNEKDYVKFGIRTKVTDVEILTVFDEETVAIRCYGLAKVPDEKFGDVLMVCNQLNNEYRFVKFLIDEDNEVNLEQDAILEENTAGEETFELVAQTIRMADKAYPQIMKALWG